MKVLEKRVLSKDVYVAKEWNGLVNWFKFKLRYGGKSQIPKFAALNWDRNS
jgi:hypothetical protein